MPTALQCIPGITIKVEEPLANVTAFGRIYETEVELVPDAEVR